jgi:PKD repeat protein
MMAYEAFKSHGFVNFGATPTASEKSVDWKLKEGVLIQHSKPSQVIYYGAWDRGNESWSRWQSWPATDGCEITAFTTQGGVVAWICKRQKNRSVDEGWRVLYSIFDRGNWVPGNSGAFYSKKEITNLSIKNATVYYLEGGAERKAGYNDRTWDSRETRPIAYFVAGPKRTGNKPLTAWFADMSIAGKEIKWDFGDSSKTSANQCPKHTFIKEGNFIATQTIKGIFDISNSYAQEFNVKTVPKPPTARFEASPKRGSWPLTVNFTDTSKGLVSSYQWDFADGHQSTERNPSHTFYVPGTYHVSLRVDGPTGYSKFNLEVVVESLPNSAKCGDTEALIKALEEASSKEETIINLNPENKINCVYELTSLYSKYLGPTNGYEPAGLPIIRKEVTINGNGATIARKRSATQKFRIFHVHKVGSLYLKNLTVSDGHIPSHGAGILNYGFLYLFQSTIFYNRASISRRDAFLVGGGIYNSGTANLYDSNFIYNSAHAQGGGVYNAPGGKLYLTNCTLSSNDTIYSGYGRQGFGGGIFNRGNASITNTTITKNKGHRGGGGVYTSGGNVVVGNSIIVNNSGGHGNCGSYQGNIISRGYNIDSDGSCFQDSNKDMPNTKLALGLLTDNGGPTRTHMILMDSDAIDPYFSGLKKMKCSHRDQRGLLRADGILDLERDCDIGAVEYYPVITKESGIVTFEDDPDSRDLVLNGKGCPSGFEYKFLFKAHLSVKPDTPWEKLRYGLSNLVVQVDTIKGNTIILQNAENGPAIGKAYMTIPQTGDYEDGFLAKGESVEIPFVLCMKSLSPFSLLVNLLAEHY